MMRECTRCGRPFTPKDLDRAESKEMESERKAAGLEGVRFLHYRCPDCVMSDIFVDILPLEGESDEDFLRRRDEMDVVVREMHTDQAAAVVIPVTRER
jgi:hypothetical protein